MCRKALTSEFGSVDAFKSAFNAKAAAIQGSGWCWLVKTKSGRVDLETTKDQDPSLAGTVIL